MADALELRVIQLPGKDRVDSVEKFTDGNHLIAPHSHYLYAYFMAAGNRATEVIRDGKPRRFQSRCHGRSSN